MKSGRTKGALSLAMTIVFILAGALVLCGLFYLSWIKLNQKVERILEDQFNQQQLMLARKIGDSLESYFDFLENALLGYAGLFQTLTPEFPDVEASLAERFVRHKNFGVLELRTYNAQGVLEKAFSTAPRPPPPGSLVFPANYLQWAADPAHQGRLFLSETYVSEEPDWRGQRVMRFFAPLYLRGNSGHPGRFAGVLELLINPFFIAEKVTQGVRSGDTGYAWIIDQDEIVLAHYEKEFVGQNALQVRLARNPNITFKGLREIQDLVLSGHEGVGHYESGWHRTRLGLTPKLVAYTPVQFNKGLITGVTDVQDPAHNMWGVAVVAPLAEVSGHVAEVLHQELFLVGLFFLGILLGVGALIGVALTWNKTLAREVELKTRELVESHDRLVHSERFAAVGEAASYVSHEIKNPLMVIGGLAQQVARRLADNPDAVEKLHIIETEVRRLENFLGDLRDFLRPAPPVKQKIDLNQVIKEVETLMGEAAREKGINLSDRLAPSLPPVEADPNRMKQILLNLIKNALEALDSGGQITVSTGAGEDQVWFAIQDTGPGMSKEVLDKIFNPFFTTKEKGTGLGLAVIHKIVTDHHGDIAVESAPGKGSKFVVSLPRPS
jgi:two-component system sensor histidine kinase HydH